MSRSRLGDVAVRAETLERLLADTSAGLSANAIAKQADAGYARTLKLLHELEAAGQVRRSGARRSTAWHLITDEQRIAERTAELERLRSAPGQRSSASQLSGQVQANPARASTAQAIARHARPSPDSYAGGHGYGGPRG